MDQIAQQETESLSDSSVKLGNIHQGWNELIEKLNNEVERSEEKRAASLKTLEEIEEANKKIAQEVKDLRKGGGVIHHVVACAKDLKRKICWVAHQVYSVFQAIFNCVRAHFFTE